MGTTPQHLDNYFEFYSPHLKKIRKSDGSNYLAICPYHQDKDPSFCFDIETGQYYCFGCGRKGNAVTFARDLGITIPPNLVKESQKPRKLTIPREAVEAWHKTLFEDGDPTGMYQYLREKRGLSREVLENYRIGWDGNRIVIPIPDAEGNVINVRRYHPEEKPKMLSFGEGYGENALFPLDQLEGEKIVIAEGEMDTLKLISEGIPAITNTTGAKSWKPEWNELFRGMAAILCSDNDQAGLERNHRLAGELRGIAEKIFFIDWENSIIGEIDKGDVSDFFEREGTLDELRKLAKPIEELAPLPENEEQRKSKPKDNKEASQRTSLAQKIIETAENEVEEFFCDQNGEAWARFWAKDHYELYLLSSKAFKDWLSRLLWQNERTAIYPEALKTALAVLSAKAKYEGNRYQIHTRIAWHEGAIWVDLTNEKWQAVRITPEAWDIVDTPPILFRRLPHQLPMEGGEDQGNLDLVESWNVKSKGDTVLFKIWLVTIFIPDIPHAILVLHGPQGSAKTTLSKEAKAVSDPHVAEVLSVPRDVAELAQILSHHHVCTFDNLSRLPEWVSDALCRSVSGDGFSKRKLFTDDEDVVFKYQRCVILNGINIVATRPDLLDRSLILGLERPNTVRAEDEIWEEFREALPNIRATIFSIISKAMAIKPTIHLKGLPRMADFVQWGFAVAEAMGIGGNQFLQTYYDNIGCQHEMVIEDSPVATALVSFMEGRDEWKGRTGDLLTELVKVAEGLGINTTKGKRWPSQPNVLARKLRQLQITLEGVGIGFEDKGRTASSRCIRLFINREKERHNRHSPRNQSESLQNNDDGKYDDAEAYDDNTVIAPEIQSYHNYQESLQNDDDDGNDGDFPLSKKEGENLDEAVNEPHEDYREITI